MWRERGAHLYVLPQADELGRRDQQCLRRGLVKEYGNLVEIDPIITIGVLSLQAEKVRCEGDSGLEIKHT
jgi:hypothetical protein